MAAYTNRNLIFEQRTAANQYRSTQALEAAQAGLEWAMSMLNSGRVTDTCAASAVATDPSFRQRYLAVDPVSGQINVNLQSDGVSPLMPSCVFDGTNWVCSCPADGNPVLAAPAGAGVFPAFRVRLMPAAPSRPGVVRIESNGCTRLDNACLDFPSAAVAGEGRSTLFATLALRNGLAAPPIAAVTAGRALDVGGAALGIVNADPASTGVTVLAGGLVNIVGLRLQSHPGTPVGPTVLASDPALAALGRRPDVRQHSSARCPPSIACNRPRSGPPAPLAPARRMTCARRPA